MIMKAWHWVLVAIAAYELIGGVMELSSGTVSFPTLGTLVNGSTGGSPTTGAAIDIGAAVLLFYFPLHHHLMA